MPKYFHDKNNYGSKVSALRKAGKPLTFESLKAKGVDEHSAARIAHAVKILDEYKRAFGDIAATFVVGSSARGTVSVGKTTFVPYDLNLVIVRRNMFPLREQVLRHDHEPAPKSNIFVLREDELARRLEAKDNLGRVLRGMLVTPVVALHGDEVVRSLKKTAWQNLSAEDLKQLVKEHSKKRFSALRAQWLEIADALEEHARTDESRFANERFRAVARELFALIDLSEGKRPSLPKSLEHLFAGSGTVKQTVLKKLGFTKQAIALLEKGKG